MAARRGSGRRLLGVFAGAAGAYWLARRYAAARAVCPPFRREPYRHSNALASAFRSVWDNPDDLRSLYTNGSLTPALTDKIMLAISGVYSSEPEAAPILRRAMRMGFSQEQALSLLHGEVTQATGEEAPAVYFAVHYAERGGQPDSDLVEALVRSYGHRTAHDLITYMRLAMFANLAGNTLDALLSRTLGQPCADSTLGEELKTLLMFGFGIVPLFPLLVLRMGRCHEPAPLALEVPTTG